ncbi:transcriptional regulator [Methylobacterium sp. Leaf399]|uniref:Cu(I)-responsive transcriptional regulator n=1 Tax=unclassified Methylobacterium TaxID=2615210 RepID=UPI0006FCEB31|nr:MULTISPECIES: Cu(I)-responsive transcriptional regulator [unclassified Methylobacterium]KQP48885.1 transcriptional regulator [Methylobacterium sp. Leaf108]KQT16578.1 transcriptional regulator [Methylobacterium sp. Leaf399]KQT86641.1 transcriptional regulator [Methylobacterium sp. Leaf466]
MNIGQAAQASGVSAKMIRHYEAIGLVPQADRRDSGYRDYGTADLHRFRFIRHARDLGFSLERIKVLLGLWSDPERSNAEVKAIAKAHIQELEGRARQLQEMAEALRSLADACDGDGRPDCPIIASLETGENVPASHAGAALAAPEPPGPRRRARAGH